MYGHFVIFYIRQFYFILFILPPAVGTPIWGNIIAPLMCMKHILLPYVFWLLLINFTLANSWPAHRGCSHLLHSPSCGTDSLQDRGVLVGTPAGPARASLQNWLHSLGKLSLGQQREEPGLLCGTAKPQTRCQLCFQAASSTDLHFFLQPR